MLLMTIVNDINGILNVFFKSNGINDNHYQHY